MINSMVKVCAGIDVHEAIVVVCLMKGELDKQPETIIKEFETFPDSLNELALWLDEQNCEQVAMESTGIYWKPVWAMLEEHKYSLILANAKDIKNKPGRKTDTLDAEWIASLLRCGLIESSFVPDKQLRDLRNCTRLYRKTRQNITQIKNRFHKLLEDSGIKITQLISDIFGPTGIKIIEKILKKEEITREFLYLITSRGGSAKLRKKIPNILRALDSEISDINIELLNILYNQYNDLNTMLDNIHSLILKQIEPYNDELNLLQTIPGISDVSAEIILAEIGTDMSVFPTKNHLSSWAGICPGNYESAGKRKNARTTKRGSKTLKGTLGECAYSAVKQKDSYFGKLYGKFVKRQGKTKAMVSVANNLLQVIYIVLKNKTPYVEMELKLSEKQNKKRIQKMIEQLEQDGYIITKNSPIIL